MAFRNNAEQMGCQETVGNLRKDDLRKIRKKRKYRIYSYVFEECGLMPSKRGVVDI